MDWVRERLSAINAIKQWRRKRIWEEKEEEKGRLLKFIKYPEFYNNNTNNTITTDKINNDDDTNNNNNNNDHRVGENFFVINQITDELYLMTLKDETKDIYDKVFVTQNEITQLNLNANEIERIFVVYITPTDSLIIAKFSSNLCIHIYAQHVFNNAFDIIHLVFITKEIDIFSQIILSYRELGLKKDLIPPTNLQNLCLSKIIKDNLYERLKKKKGKEMLPPMILRDCRKLKTLIEEFFEHAENFYKNGCSLRYEPSHLISCDFLYSKLPEKFDSERGLICRFPRIKKSIFQRKVM